MKKSLLKRLEDRKNKAANLVVKDLLISQDFSESPTLEELANAQNVKPLADVRVLFGTWPGEENDGFEKAIDELRHGNMEGDNT